MSRKQEDILDDDGNVLPRPAPDHDVSAAIYLMEYCRTRGFQVGPTLKVGETLIQIRDLRQQAQQAHETARPDVEPGSDMATLLGGDQ